MGLVSARPSATRQLAAAALLLAPLLGLACSSNDLIPEDGVCQVDAAVSCSTSLIPKINPAPGTLVGYSCTGRARPDSNARYVEGVPQGIVCASRGNDAAGKPTYCCAPEVVPCAYNPVAQCEPGADGYQCLGSSRPEALNTAIKCGNAVNQGDYLNYCCSGQADGPRCTPSGPCPSSLLPFTCPPAAVPRSDDLPMSASRADYARPMCSVPALANNQRDDVYCCFMPAPVDEGTSCVQNTKVPGCQSGKFGFSCYGFDTPPESFPVTCAEPGFAGRSAEGHPATLYCCDFK